MMWRIDGHMALVNALALKLAGIDRTTRNPPGGEIERDKDGNPTGILKDAAAALVQRVMPPLSEEEKDRAMDASMREAAAHGVTSVQNMAETPEDEGQPVQFRQLEKLERTGKLTFRVYQSMNVRDWKTLADLGVATPFGSAKLRIGNLKSFADGALGSETAWMDEPFANHPGYKGISSSDLLNLDHYYEELRQADKEGCRFPFMPLATGRIARFWTCMRGWRRKTGLPTGGCASSMRSTCTRLIMRASRSWA